MAAGGKTIATAANAAASTEYKDKSTNTLALSLVSNNIKKSECTNPSVMLSSKAVGKDNWHFNAMMHLYFSDGTKTSVSSRYERRLVSTNSTRTPPLDLQGPSQTASSSNTNTSAPAPKSGVNRVTFARSGKPGAKYQGMDVWIHMGIAPALPNTAVVTSIKNTSKYPIKLTREVGVSKVTLAPIVIIQPNQITTQFADADWKTYWILYGPIQDDPPDGYPNVEFSWKTK